MGRVLDGIRLSGLGFLGGVLFLCKKAFYVFLRTNQFLHLVPCLAVVWIGGFLLGQQLCELLTGSFRDSLICHRSGYRAFRRGAVSDTSKT